MLQTKLSGGACLLSIQEAESVIWDLTTDAGGDCLNTVKIHIADLNAYIKFKEALWLKDDR